MKLSEAFSVILERISLDSYSRKLSSIAVLAIFVISIIIDVQIIEKHSALCDASFIGAPILAFLHAEIPGLDVIFSVVFCLVGIVSIFSSLRNKSEEKKLDTIQTISRGIVNWCFFAVVIIIFAIVISNILSSLFGLIVLVVTVLVPLVIGVAVLVVNQKREENLSFSCFGITISILAIYLSVLFFVMSS